MRDRDLLKMLVGTAAILGALLVLVAHFRVTALPADPYCDQAIGKADFSAGITARGDWSWSFETGSNCEHYRPDPPVPNASGSQGP